MVDRGVHAVRNHMVDSGVSGSVIITVRHVIGRPVCNGCVGHAAGLRTRSRGGRYNRNSLITVRRYHPLSGAGS